MGLLWLWVLAAGALAAPVYKYQDENGQWRFSDKKPKTEFETVQFKPLSQNESDKPGLRYEQVDGVRYVVADNPWFAPVEFRVFLEDKLQQLQVIPANSSERLMIRHEPFQWQEGMRYRYQMGDTCAQFDGEPLLPPVSPLTRYKITQSFAGKYSHSAEPNVHAVDIAMHVGEGVHAARAGTVVTVKDDYHMGGRDRYFMDKANLIRVLHDDGTFAVYGHILMGSALVNPGQQVQAGQQLARSGSSGYSTGPHLHFVLQRNQDGSWVSIPFEFKQAGRSGTPKEGQWLQAQ